MKTFKRLLTILSMALLVVGFSSEISAMLTYVGNYVGLSQEQVCLALGGLNLFILIMTNIIETRVRNRRALRQSEQALSDLERKVFGRVITISELRAKKAEKAKEPVVDGITLTAQEADELSRMDLKDQKYFISQKKMEIRRKTTHIKPKKAQHHVQKEERPSLKARCGGTRRAS